MPLPISELASHVLDDGDDLIRTASFRPAEDASSTLGISSYADNAHLTRYPPPLRRQFSGFSEVSSPISMAEYYANQSDERAPPAFWKRFPLVHTTNNKRAPPIKKVKWPWRGKGGGGARGGGGGVHATTRVGTAAAAAEQEQFPVAFNDAQHYIRRPTRTSLGDVGSVMSIRSHRLNVADGRNLLVRQKAQVVGRDSMAAAEWELDSRVSPASMVGGQRNDSTTSIRRYLSLDDGASVVSHLTEADFLSRTNHQQHMSRIMFFAPRGSILGNLDGDGDGDTEGEVEDGEHSPYSECGSNSSLMHGFDAPSYMSRPSTGYKEAGFGMAEVAEDDEDSTLGSEDDDYLFPPELNNTTETNVIIRKKSISQRKARTRTLLTENLSEWRPPSPLEGSSHTHPSPHFHQNKNQLGRRRGLDRSSSDSDAIQVLAQMLENPADRIFPHMEYEARIVSPMSRRRLVQEVEEDRNVTTQFSPLLNQARPQPMTRSRRSRSGPDTCPVDQPLRPRIFTGSPKKDSPLPDSGNSAPEGVDAASLWDRRMMMKTTRPYGGETCTDGNLYDGLSNMVEESQEVYLDEEERAEVLVASWHRWLSDPEIDVLADVPLPGNVQSARPTKRNVVDLEPQTYQRRPRGKSDSDVALFNAGDPEFSSMPCPQRKASLGMERSISQTRRSPMPDVPYQRPGTTNSYPIQESSNVPSQRQPLPSRKLSDSEGTTSVERTLPRPTAQSRNRADSVEQQKQQRQRIFSDSELTISSGITEVTRFLSLQQRHNSHAWTKNTHLYMDDGDDSTDLHHPRGRMFSDSEVTASSWSSSLRLDYPTDTEGSIQFTALSTPTALGAAKQIASSMGRLLDAGAATIQTIPVPMAARNLYAATASNSRCRDYYWNEGVGGKDRSTPIASPQGAEIQWSDSTDSYADVF